MKSRKWNQKGFTLVEVIVVLVILAVLIAVTIPSVMKYIEDAEDAKYYAQTRYIVQTYETALLKASAGNGGKISAKDAAEIERNVTDEVNEGHKGTPLEAYGQRAFTNAHPKNFDDGDFMWRKDGDKDAGHMLDVKAIKSYVVAYNGVAGYQSYHVIVSPNDKVSIVKHPLKKN